MVKQEKWNGRELEEKKYNYREVLETFFPHRLIAAIKADLEERKIEDIAKQLNLFGEMPTDYQESDLFQIINEYTADLLLRPEQRMPLSDSRKIILNRYVICAYERVNQLPYILDIYV